MCWPPSLLLLDRPVSGSKEAAGPQPRLFLPFDNNLRLVQDLLQSLILNMWFMVLNLYFQVWVAGNVYGNGLELEVCVWVGLFR